MEPAHYKMEPDRAGYFMMDIQYFKLIVTQTLSPSSGRMQRKAAESQSSEDGTQT